MATRIVDASTQDAAAIPTPRRLGAFSGEDAVLVQLGERVFKLSPTAWLVLESLGQDLDDVGLAQRLNDSGLLPGGVTAGQAGRMAERVRARVFDSSAVPARASDVWARVTLFRGEQLRRFLAVAAGAYVNTWVFYGVLALALAANVGWMFLAPLPALSPHDLLRTPLVLMGMLAISFLHEIAHAAAAHRYRSAPAAIGAGLYLGVPVLYADVTGIWCLPARARIVVNLAGVQAQLALNLLLIVLLPLLADPTAHWVVLSLCWMNACAAFVNLVPFAKLDGYWVVADGLGSPHLERDANRVMAHFARRTLGRATSAPAESWPLALYAIGQMTVYGVFALWIVMALAHTIATIHNAPTLAAGARSLLEGSVWQLALIAFVIFRLVARTFSGGRHQPEKARG
ncbi:MAG: hypothetical protein ACYC9L_02945 [Sulfuricaulis sp.]